MVKLFHIFLLLSFSGSLNAQYYFNKLYDYNGGDTVGNHATSIIELSNGDFFVVGNKFLPNYSSLHYIRINPNGDTIFNKRYPKTNCAFYTSIGNSLIKTYDGNLVHGGCFYDSLSNANALLVKCTENGDTLWTKTYGGANFDNANMVCQTPDSGFVLMGVTQSFSTGSASDFYLIKTDKNGNFQWQQAYGTTASEDCVSGQITLDGGYIMSGHKSNVLHIVKTDALGGFQWQQTYTGTKNVGFVTQLADSSYILTGAKNIVGLGDQAYMLKLSKNGGIIWQKDYGTLSNDIFYTRPIILSDGSIVVGGRTMLGSIPIGMLVKTDSSGNQKWLRTYYANTTIDNYVYDLKQTSDNGFIFVGTGYISSQDAWVVRVDSAGCEIANCNVGISENQDPKLRINIFPNPAYDQIQISIPGENLTGFDIRVSNILGKTIQVVRSGEVLDISGLSSGIYFVTTTSKDKQKVLTSKFIKK